MAEQQKKLDEKLANMTNQTHNTHSTNGSANIMGNALKRKAADKAADYLFDQLF